MCIHLTSKRVQRIVAKLRNGMIEVYMSENSKIVWVEEGGKSRYAVYTTRG